MKNVFKTLFSYCLIIGLGIVVSCKPTEPTPRIVPSQFWIGLLEGDSPLGLVINDPISKRQYAVFGKRNTAGNMTSVSNVLSSEPSTGRWVMTDLDNKGQPTGFHTGDGRSVAITRNANGGYHSRVYDTATNRTLGESDSPPNPNADLGKTLEQLQRDAESLLAGDISPLARSAILADMANLATNAVGCVAGLGALASGPGIVVGLIGAYSTYSDCRSALDALSNIINGRPTFGCVSASDGLGLLPDAANAILSSASSSFIHVAAEVASAILPDVINSGIQAASAGVCRQTNAAGSHGDPHLTTTDGLSYGFHGHGEFIASKSTADNFEVQVRQEDNYKTGYATLNTALAVQTGTDIVCVTLKPAALYINNKAQALNFTSLSLKDGAKITRVATTGKVPYLNIYSKSGDLLRVWFEGVNYLDFEVSLPESRKGKVIGTLGNNDGNPKNDLQIRNGITISGSFSELYPTFADSWRIEQASSLFYYESGKNTTTYTQKDFPRTKFNISNERIAQAEAVCKAAGVTAEPFLNNCILDVALTNDNSLAKSALLAQQNDKNPNKTIITPCNGNLDGKWGDFISSVYPNSSRGMVIEHKNGEGKVIVSPVGCPYKVGEVFWKNANFFNCTVDARTTNRANYSTDFATIPIIFYPINDEMQLGDGNVTFLTRVK